MKAEQVDKALTQKFITEAERLVFWHDSAGEFTAYIDAGLPAALQDVQVLRLANVGGLSAKLRLERAEQDEREAKYLIYSHGEPPAADQDWLLDVRLYSAQFHADMASIWREELGLSNVYLRQHLKDRAVFLANRERRKKLKRLLTATDDEATIDLKMMAVVVGSQVADPFAVLVALCDGHVADDEYALDERPAAMVTFEKMGLIDGFWQVMCREFAYQAEVRSVAGVLRRIFISELLHQTGADKLPALAQHLLPSLGCRNAVVFLTQWRDSAGRSGSYDAAASAIAKEQKISEALGGLELETIADVYTFWDAERRVVSKLKDRLLSDGAAQDLASLKAMVSERQAGYWLAQHRLAQHRLAQHRPAQHRPAGPGTGAPERQAICDAYDAIVAAARLFILQREHHPKLNFETPEALLAAYTQDLYEVDRLYRRFSTQSQAALGQGWNLLKDLADEVERTYDEGFLQPLGMAWSQLLDAGFLGRWSTKKLPAQQDFYADKIKRHLDSSNRARAFVIISDAFRYEAATELTEALKGRERMDAECSAMLGVLPSYTALGMASLLPHETLSYNAKGEVLADDNSTAGTAARDKQLATVGGMACQASKLRVMKTDEARASTANARVVYIYHNVIDARGDSAATEGETFDAVSTCIAELTELVHFCIGRLNAAKVWVTADHGFLFQRNAPTTTDKSKLSHKPTHSVKAKKRYIIGPNLGDAAEAHHGNVETTSGAGGGMEFWLPRAANRFHFVGGARFVHGGAMPQEVVIPVVTVTQLRGDRAKQSKVEKVSVTVVGGTHKITAPKYRFEFIQTKAVSARQRAITLRGAVYDGTEPVSTVITLTFDSSSDDMEERKKQALVQLRSGTFDKKTPYRLVLRDVETDAEVLAVPVVIDRSFDDDF